MSLFLVRHAEPLLDPRTNPADRPLSPAGRRAAAGLQGAIPSGARWVSSIERKAYETLLEASPEAVTIGQEERFGEVLRVEPFDDAVRERRRAWVEGRLDARHEGWETPHEAAERFEAGVRGHVEDTGSLVVGTHGMVMTAWLVHARGQVSTAAAGAFWVGLDFPEVVRVDGL